MRTIFFILIFCSFGTMYSQSSLDGGSWVLELDYDWEKIDEYVIENEVLEYTNALTLKAFHEVIRATLNSVVITFDNGDIIVRNYIAIYGGRSYKYYGDKFVRFRLYLPDDEFEYNFNGTLHPDGHGRYIIRTKQKIIQEYFDLLKREPKIKRIRT